MLGADTGTGAATGAATGWRKGEVKGWRTGEVKGWRIGGLKGWKIEEATGWTWGDRDVVDEGERRLPAEGLFIVNVVVAALSLLLFWVEPR